MSDRLNWYPETGPERRARRGRRYHTARIWLIVIAVVCAVLFVMGGPFVEGTRCTTATVVDKSTGAESMRVECHQVRGWRP